MYSALKNKNFRNLLIGQAISQFGDAGYHMMFIFFIYNITNSSKITGYIGALEALPFFLLSPLAGTIADRINRKKIMIYSDLLSGVILIILGIASWGIEKPSLVLLSITALLLSVVNTFFSPAKSASIPRLVEIKYLMEANGLSNSIQTIVPLFGTAIIVGFSGYIMQKTPKYFLSILSGINALTFLASALFIKFIPDIEPEKQKSHSVLKDIVEGIKFILKQPVIRVILIAECIFTFFTAPIIMAIIKLNKVWFGGSSSTLTYLETSFGLGMLTSSLFISKIKINRPAPFYITATTICAIGIIGISFCKQIEVLIIRNFIIGLTIPFINVPVYTYIQSIVADQFQGRVNSAINMLTLGMIPFSLGIAGILLDYFSLEYFFQLMGLGAFISVAVALLSKDFLKARFNTF